MEVAVRQRGPPAETSILKDLPPSQNETLAVPDWLNTLIPANNSGENVEPTFQHQVQPQWFSEETVACQGETVATALLLFSYIMAIQ